MRNLSKFWSPLIALAMLVFSSDQMLGQNAKRGQKNAKRGTQQNAKTQATSTIGITDPDVLEAQSFLSTGVARIDGSLECVC